MLDKAILVSKNLCQGKNDYETGGIFYGLFLAPKIKFCLTIDEFGYVQEQKTFIWFFDSKRLLDRLQNFKMRECKKNELSYQNLGKNRLIVVLSYQQKWDFVMIVMIKECVIFVVFKLTKIRHRSYSEWVEKTPSKRIRFYASLLQTIDWFF